MHNWQSTIFLVGVRVTRSLVLYVCFVGRCLSFCTFSFGHCLFFDIRILITPLISSNSFLFIKFKIKTLYNANSVGMTLFWNNSAHPMICEGCHFTHICQTIARLHHFTEWRFSQPPFIKCTKPRAWVIICAGRSIGPVILRFFSLSLVLLWQCGMFCYFHVNRNGQ